MIIVLVPMIVLLSIVLIKKIPVIGGDIRVGLLCAGVLALLMGGIVNPIDWIKAFIDGIDRISWVIFLGIFGSIYSVTQVKLGTVNAIMSALKAKFYKSPKALVLCIMFVLILAGSLLGDAAAASTVVGVLTIGTLAAIGLSGEAICAIIVMGASLGSIMPPMTQALFLSASLVDTPVDPVLNIAYFTVSIIAVLTCIYVVIFMLRNVKQLEIDSPKKASQIMKENWVTMIPITALILVVLFRSINGPLKFDLMTSLLNAIPGGNGKTFLDILKGIPILKGISNGVVLCIIFAIIISFFFAKVRNQTKEVFATGLKNIKNSFTIQICAGFMLGSFYCAGQIEAVQVFAQGLDSNVLKIGGAVCLALIGMLVGSQSTAQNVIFSFFGPALVAAGVNPTYAALAGAHIAAAGQGAPPADLTTFLVSGIVGGNLNTKVDPLKSMFYSLPMCIFMFAVGIIMMYFPA